MIHAPHAPVMCKEMLAAMEPRDGEVYLDGTFGAGGYSRALLEAASCTVYAIDRDPEAAKFAKALEEKFPNRFVFIAGCFSDLMHLLEARGVSKVHGIVLDIGVSSMQIDQADRGFSFRADGPLDMRMSQNGPSAADIVNGAAEEVIADILYRYGEERASRRIARAIVKARAEEPITRTRQLADIVGRAIPRGKQKIDPATRTFQALRIEVNDELGELERALVASEKILSPGGRLVVAVFHSLEDRIVKQFLVSRCGKTPGASRHLPTAGDETLPTFLLPQRKVLKVSDEEARVNSRARSAKLRVAIRTEVAA